VFIEQFSCLLLTKSATTGAVIGLGIDSTNEAFDNWAGVSE
jgi:hypothetical protein